MMLFEELVSYLAMKYELEWDENMVHFSDLEIAMEYDDRSGEVSIYREFIYPDDENIQLQFRTEFEKLIFLQNLFLSSIDKPQVDIECPMGCPFSVIQVGFWGVKMNGERVLEILEAFERANDGEEKLDYKLLEDKYPQELAFYKEMEKEIKERLSFLEGKAWRQITSLTKPDDKDKYNSIYTNSSGSIIVCIGSESLRNVCELLGVEKYGEAVIYKGFDYCIGKRNSENVYWDVKLLYEVEDIIEEMELDYEYDTRFYISDRTPYVLLVECACFWGVILSLKGQGYDKAILERKKLLDRYDDVMKFIPPDQVIEDTIDFSCILAEDFENMCKDILAELGFSNILSRGKTNAPDGGVDIECDEEVKGILENRVKHWIFQCKHVKNQIDRKDLTEIPMLLKEFSADYYGLFYSGTFSPQTLDRIKVINKNEGDCIKVWDGFQITQLVNKYENVKKKYFRI